MSVKVRQFHPGKWSIVIHHNKKRWVQLVGRSEDDANKYARELRRELLKNGYGILDQIKIGKPDGVTIKEYAERWQNEIEQFGLKKKTIESYKSNLKYHVVPVLGDFALRDLNYSILKDWIIPKVEYGYRRDTVRLMVATLRAMMAEAVKEEILLSNPVVGLSKLFQNSPKLKADPDPFSLEELHAVEEKCRLKYSEYYPLTLCLSRTGMRFGEAIALKLEDVDIEKREAFVRANIPTHRELTTPKTPASIRTVEMSPQLCTVLQAMLAARKAAYFAKGKPMPDWLFVTHEGNPPEHSNFSKTFDRAQKQAKVRRRTPHDLRHSFASLSLLAGKPLAWVSAQLGHRSPAITLSLYTRWVKETKAEKSDALDAPGQIAMESEMAENK